MATSFADTSMQKSGQIWKHSIHPMQFASVSTNIGTQPSLFGPLRQAKTSTGQTLRQKPQALHMSSLMTTSHLPAFLVNCFFSALNSAIVLSRRPTRPGRHLTRKRSPRGSIQDVQNPRKYLLTRFGSKLRPAYKPPRADVKRNAAAG